MYKDRINKGNGITKCIILTLLFMLCSSVHAGNGKSDKGYWIDKYLSVSFPLKSIHVNSMYGVRRDPFNGKAKVHAGLDLQAHYEEALSMFDGYVKRVGKDGKSGNYVIMQYGNYTITYCHLSEIWVNNGDPVYSGVPVGVTGSTGRSTGPHLHITVRLNGKITDPYDLLLYIRDVKRSAVQALGIHNNKILSPEEFISLYAELAKKQQKLYGIPASVTLAQMAFESNWGNSDLARDGQNFFGIKANLQWIASGRPYSIHDDDLKNEKFCSFSSPEESMEFHSRLLMSDRYSRCRKYAPTDYHNWLVGIKRAGYATAKDYVSKCEKIIRQYRLDRYDSQAENEIF